MNRFPALSATAISMGETNDCGVKAIAVAAEATYQDAHCACEMFGRKPGKGTPWDTIINALDILGFKAVEYFDGKAINKVDDIDWTLYRKTTLNPVTFTGYTVNNVLKDPQFKKGNYLMFTYSHVLAVRDGIIHDWTQNRRHRIKMIWKIEEE